MNNKPFDLQKALAGEPVIDGNGSIIEEIFYFSKTTVAYPVYCSIKGSIYTFTINGVWDTDIPGSSNNLFMAPKPVEYWVATANTKDGSIVASNPAKQEETAISILKNVWGENRVLDIQTHKITRYE